MSEDNDVEKFKGFLIELFRIDLQDLDFGIYRIMKAKQDMITEFIDKELISIVDSVLNEISADDNLKNEVFNLSYEFFSRYYSDGDFIPQIRYGGRDKYMIPYNGQEVELYWATRNAYYVKTTEYFTNYSFVVSDPFDTDKKYKVNFKIREAALEKNYVVSEKKYFLLDDEPVRVHDGEVDIFFNYRPLTEDESKKFEGNEKAVKDALKQRAEETILKEVPNELAEILSRRTQEKDIERSVLRRHLDIYTRKNESDYFIVKNLGEFLNSELNNFIKNEVLTIDNDFNVSESNRSLAKVVSVLCQKIIEQISQIEDFQRILWEKRKFAYNVNYVITLDKIANKKDGIGAIKKILNDDGINKQVEEWKELGIVADNFDAKMIIQNGLTGETLNEKFKSLPIDTKYFKDLELDILSFFDDLDNELDGWLIHSENYQALNTILPKFRERVQTIYIDPPFNKEQDADYLYNVKYKDATWITMLENRIQLGKEALNEKGSIFVRCDYNGNYLVRPLMNEIFGKENFRNEIIIAKTKEFFKTMTHINKFSEGTESLFFFSKTNNSVFNLTYIKKSEPSKYEPFLPIEDKSYQDFRIINGIKYYSPKGRKWGLKQEDIEKLIKEKRLVFENNKWYLITYEEPLKNVWIDRQGYSRTWNFKTENSEIFIKRVIESTSNEGDLILDFFLGSGTTSAVAHKLRRKWIGVEMGEHFYKVVLPRMKKVLAYDKSEISKDEDVKQIYNENNAGGFFKYYDLEQYEDSLNNIKIDELHSDERIKPYLIEYILESGLTDSTISINKEMLADPFSIKMRIIAGGVEQEVNIDLVETFSLWYGIDVEKILSTNRDGVHYIFVKGKKERQKTIIIWRSTKGLDFVAEKAFLTETLKKEFKIDDPSEEYSQVLINGDSALDLSDFGVDVRSLDPIFFRLQWEG